MSIDETYIADTLTELVRINSINPAFSGAATDESSIARRVGELLQALGMEVVVYDAAPGRRSVVGRRAGSGNRPSLMLYGHLDTVGVQGMAAPFSGVIQDGRVYGRGAYDMKGGLAACIGAVKAIADAGVTLEGDLYVVAVADEETESAGMMEVLRHVRTDGAIVTEATELDVCIAHKGFCWIEVETTGKAAHGSKYLEGIDANMHMGRFLAQLARLEEELHFAEPHPLLGPPTIHAPLIQGGVGISTYSPSCVLRIERRTLPGEHGPAVLKTIEAIIDDLRGQGGGFAATARLLLERPSFQTPATAAIVRNVTDAAARVLEHVPKHIGHSYWMDAALLSAAGIETVVLGPVGAGAHAAEEYVELGSVFKLAEILAIASVSYCGPST